MAGQGGWRSVVLAIGMGAALVAGARGAGAASGSPAPAAAGCPLVRAGTRMACRLPEDTCDSGLLTAYAACIGDTASDASPGVLVDALRPSAIGGRFRMRVDQCPLEVTVYRCSCTPLGDYCAPGSACKRTAVIAGTVIPPDGLATAVPCGPAALDPAGPLGPVYA